MNFGDEMRRQIKMEQKKKAIISPVDLKNSEQIVIDKMVEIIKSNIRSSRGLHVGYVSYKKGTSIDYRPIIKREEGTAGIAHPNDEWSDYWYIWGPNKMSLGRIISGINSKCASEGIRIKSRIKSEYEFTAPEDVSIIYYV